MSGSSPDMVRRLGEILDDLRKGRVLVVGDVMLDNYLIGDARRISPEAPVPVVRVEKRRKLLGGAGNVARNIAALGGRANLVGLIGEDQEGRDLKALLGEAGVDPCLVTCADRPTTVKTRVLARNQQMIRLDMEQTHAVTSREYADLLEALAALLPLHDVVVVSDYGKGLVTDRLLPDLRRLAEKEGRKTPLRILVDPKPQNRDCYHGAFLLTPNARETSEASGLPVSGRDQVLAAGRRLREELGADHVLTTLGADGMALFGEGEPVWHVPTVARQVFDVTGAGDTVIAAIALSIAAGAALLDACVLANYAAGIVVGKVGAATAAPEEIRASLEECPPAMERWEKTDSRDDASSPDGAAGASFSEGGHDGILSARQ